MKKSPLLPIFLIVLVDVLGYTILIPILPFYAEHFGASPVGVGLLLASYGFCQMLAGPVLGKISDQMGRRPVLLASQIGTFFGFLLLAWAPNLQMVFLARIIDGLTAGNLSVAQAYIADVTEPEKRTKAFGIIGVSFGIGFLIGPAISGVLAHYGGPALSILAAAGLSALSILFTFFLLPKSEIKYKGGAKGWLDLSVFKKAFQSPELSPYLYQFLSFIFSFSVFISGFALFAERRFTFDGRPFGAREVGYVFAYIGMLGVFMQAFLIGPLAKKFGELKLVRTGFILITASFFALAFAHSIPFLLAVLTISFVGSSVLRPSLTSLITQHARKEDQGSVLGITQSLTSISQVIAPIITGFLIGHSHLASWAYFGALAASFGIFLNFRPRQLHL